VVGARAFADARALRFIESVVHPWVKARGAAWCTAQRRRGVPLAVLVAPLLFESGMDAQVDCVATLAVPVRERCRRLGVSRGWSTHAARARMRHQMTDAARARRADFVIGNTGTPAQLAAALKTLRDTLRSHAARGAGKQHQ
jgi:dephospho-CoA kinase